MSMHPLPFLKPHWDSGSSSSANPCNLSWATHATTLPTTSNKAIPLQLWHLPFLRNRYQLVLVSVQPISWNSALFLHLNSKVTTISTISLSLQIAFIISGMMSDSPPVLPFLHYLTHWLLLQFRDFINFKNTLSTQNIWKIPSPSFQH